MPGIPVTISISGDSQVSAVKSVCGSGLSEAREHKEQTAERTLDGTDATSHTADRGRLEKLTPATRRVRVQGGALVGTGATPQGNA